MDDIKYSIDTFWGALDDDARKLIICGYTGRVMLNLGIYDCEATARHLLGQLQFTIDKNRPDGSWYIHAETPEDRHRCLENVAVASLVMLHICDRFNLEVDEFIGIKALLGKNS